MSATAAAIVRWQSTRDASRCGYEIAGFAPRRHHLVAELERTLMRADGRRPAFVFMALGRVGADDIATTMSRAAGFSQGTHVCVAIDPAALAAADPLALRDRDVGILLDQVDAGTPLDVLGNDLVEAVRFTDAFVARAMVDARSACILTAMLGLARDLGLATLAATSEGECAEFAFDYVVASASQVASGHQRS